MNFKIKFLNLPTKILLPSRTFLIMNTFWTFVLYRFGSIISRFKLRFAETKSWIYINLTNSVVMRQTLNIKF